MSELYVSKLALLLGFIIFCGLLLAIISKFALDTIVLLTALLRKQRIVIYHHDVDDLIKVILVQA